MSTALSLLALMAVGGPSLQSLLDEIRIEQEVPGISVAVARHGEISFASGSGVADIENNIKMTADTQLYAGSLSKIFTAVLALQLIEQGQLALGETIADIAVESEKLGAGIIKRPNNLSNDSDCPFTDPRVGSGARRRFRLLVQR